MGEDVLKTAVVVGVGMGENDLVYLGNFFLGEELGQLAVVGAAGAAVNKYVLPVGEFYVFGIALAHADKIDVESRGGAVDGGVAGRRSVRNLYAGGGFVKLGEGRGRGGGGKMECG